MYTALPGSSRAALMPMIAIEAKRFARHPLFLISVVVAYGWTIYLHTTDTEPYTNDILSMPVIAAFFIGLPSLVVAANLTRSTESSAEAMGTAPGTEARRTLAVAGASFVPFLAGLGYVALLLVLVWRKPVHPHEWYFGTVNDFYVWSILIGLAPIACLGGACLGVLVGRWLRFPGAPAVTVVALVVLDVIGQMLIMGDDLDVENGEYRLYVPWALWHSGTGDDGRQGLAEGNPFFAGLYMLALSALAVGGAVWHDRSVRTPALRLRLLGLIGLAGVFLALAMATGLENTISEVIPYKVDD